MTLKSCLIPKALSFLIRFRAIIISLKLSKGTRNLCLFLIDYFKEQISAYEVY